VTTLCNGGDVVIGGWTQAGEVENLTGDKRFAELAPMGTEPGGQGWTTTATGVHNPNHVSFVVVTAVCLHL
jgi:hypothetical protein